MGASPNDTPVIPVNKVVAWSELGQEAQLESIYTQVLNIHEKINDILAKLAQLGK